MPALRRIRSTSVSDMLSVGAASGCRTARISRSTPEPRRAFIRRLEGRLGGGPRASSRVADARDPEPPAQAAVGTGQLRRPVEDEALWYNAPGRRPRARLPPTSTTPPLPGARWRPPAPPAGSPNEALLPGRGHPAHRVDRAGGPAATRHSGGGSQCLPRRSRPSRPGRGRRTPIAGRRGAPLDHLTAPVYTGGETGRPGRSMGARTRLPHSVHEPS